MQAEAHAGMLFQQVDKREVGMPEGFFEHVLEIAAGLMRVYQQDEMEIRRHEGGWILHQISYPAAQAYRIWGRRAGTNHGPKFDAAAIFSGANAGLDWGTHRKTVK
jgi:hypothetical protein